MRITVYAVAACLALAPAAFASDSFTDPSDDSGGGPDIKSVTLSHTDSTVTIAVEFGSVPPLAFSESEGYTDMLLAGIHTDHDLSRTDVEYWTGLHGIDLTRAMFVRGGVPNGAWPEPPTRPSPRATVELEVELDVLGDPDAIAVNVVAGRESLTEGAAGGSDEAPAAGAHTYVLEDGGAPPWLWLVGGTAGVAAVVALVLLAARRPWRPHRVGTSH
jgi:hypothetical protein